MDTPLTITLAQLNPVAGDIEHNLNKILRISEKHSEITDIIIFSELVLCGYTPEDLLLKPSFINNIKNAVEEIVFKSKNIKSALLISCPWIIEGTLHNAALLIHNGEILAVRAKHNLPHYGVFNEVRFFKPGPLPDPVPFKGWALGILTCEDLWFPDVCAHLAQKGADTLIALNASPFRSGAIEERLDQARARTAETGLPLIYVNQIGGQDELVFDGHSFAMNKDGCPALMLKGFEEDRATLNLPLPAPADTGLAARNLPGDHALIYKALTLSLRDYVKKNSFPGVLLGLSGGIDSALSAAIAADALGPDKVQAVRLPSKHTSQDSLDDAQEQAEMLGISLETIPIKTPVTALEEQLYSHLAPNAPPVTFENLQARTRGILLMALSNSTGRLLLSTGNKSETAVGYATLYGDMCGGFNLLKDLYKTQVYALSRWRNAQSPAIPERVLTKAPTAELRPGQTDQDSLPSYSALDEILYLAIERDESAETIAKKGHDPETVRKVLNMVRRAEYKRRQSAPGPKISACAFGTDRRYPITNGFEG